MGPPPHVRLEGFHAVKHALRFGAAVTELVTTAPAEVEELRLRLAPDLDLDDLRVVDEAEWDELVGRALPSPLFARCRRPDVSLRDAATGSGPLVVLHRPTHHGNVGAVVRVAAAADAAGVVVTGDTDPWHPAAVRGAAGLQLALPVLTASLHEAVSAARETGRPVVAVDDAGADVRRVGVAHDAALVLGTERWGLPQAVLDGTDEAVAIPMRPGVSSLNLATAAAIVLYAPRRGGHRPA